MIKRIAIFLFGISVVTGSSVAEIDYDLIYIKVNEKVITKNEVEVRLFDLLNLNKISFDSTEQVSKFRKQITDTLIEEALLDLQAEELKISVTDEELDEEIDQMKKQRNLKQAEFEEALESQQMTLDQFRQNISRQIIRNRVISREVRSNIEINEELLKELYNKNYEKVFLVHARHILLRVGLDASDAEVRKVKKRLLDLKKEIESGKPFEEIATLFSEDPSAKRNHGDLGFFRKEDMRNEFSEAAFALSPGKISDPVRTPIGFHIIEVLEKKEEPGKLFAKVRDKLYQQEFQKVFVTRYKQYIDRLKKEARIIRY